MSRRAFHWQISASFKIPKNLKIWLGYRVTPTQHVSPMPPKNKWKCRETQNFDFKTRNRGASLFRWVSRHRGTTWYTRAGNARNIIISKIIHSRVSFFLVLITHVNEASSKAKELTILESPMEMSFCARFLLKSGLFNFGSQKRPAAIRLFPLPYRLNG